jgi:hypothetical protein
VTSGNRLRRADTSCADDRLPPPFSKKSSCIEAGAVPSTSVHCWASHAAVPENRAAGRVGPPSYGLATAGQCIPVDLARGACRKVVDDGELRHERCRQHVAQLALRGYQVETAG